MRDQNPDQNAGGAAVTPSQVLSAGLASAAAALVTSRFGVAGTLLGAALTTMIITGGSAILKAYLDSVTGHVRKVPAKLRSRGERKTERFSEPATIPDRPDLRDNLVGRMRAALDWFLRLPQAARRPILIKGAIAALIAFAICIGAVFVVERGIGNSLSCGLWGNCPYGATPGVHLFDRSGIGANSSISGGGVQTGGGTAAPGTAVPGTSESEGGGGLFQGVPGVGGQGPAGGSSASPAPADSGASPAPAGPEASPAPSDSEASPAPSDSEASPAPSDSGASPNPGAVQPEEPASADSSASPADSSASPAAQEAPAGREADPASASPEPAQ